MRLGFKNNVLLNKTLILSVIPPNRVFEAICARDGVVHKAKPTTLLVII
jgi:hypothetical protein